MYFSTGLIFLLVLDIIVYYLQKKHEEDMGQQETSSLSASLDQLSVHKEYHGEKKGTSLSSSVDKQFRRFSLGEVRLATHDFDNAYVIGKGGFGEVYKGKLDFGVRIDVAIKRSSLGSNQGETEFRAEIKLLSMVRHSHIVSLLGYCEESGTQEMILIYEYMPNGSLEDHLHKRKANSSPLTWLQRLQICIGAARGLDYLHTGTSVQSRIIHRDVKSSNILLDENLAAKISDFGLSRTGPAYHSRTTDVYTDHIRGTFGYMDEEYLLTHRLTRKSDVYAFGVVLFEVFCGRPAVDFTLDEQQQSLAGWARHCIQDGSIDQLVDPYLKGQVSARCLKEFSQIAYKCLHRCPKDRPTMAEVVARLEVVLTMTLQKHGGVTIARNVWLFFSMKIPAMHTKNYKNRQKWSNEKKNKKPAILDNAGTTMSKGSSEGEHKRISIVDPTKAATDHAAAMLKVKSLSSHIGEHDLKIFTYDELKRATRNFRPSAMLGFSHGESVYRGWVDTSSFAPSIPGVGIAVAIKISNTDNVQSLKEWQAEVNRGKFSHPNLVKLLGYCSEDRILCLVYECIPMTNLVNRIHRHPLQWSTTLNIAIGTARALTFLHTAEKSPSYRTFNASNILLNEDFEAQLYFGSAALNQERGALPVLMRNEVTSHYTPPEYMATGDWSVKSDTYAFGVLMLDMIAGSHFHDHNMCSSPKSLMEWARPILSNDKNLRRTIDPWLEQGALPTRVRKTADQLILSCLETDPENRPSMGNILASLEGIMT